MSGSAGPTRVYSKRLGAISGAQLQAALTRFGLGGLVCAEPIRAGNFGQTLYLTSTRGRWVLRGAPFWPWQFRKERLFTDLLHAHTDAPVPWPYLVDEDPAIFGWPYVIMPRMPGERTEEEAVRGRLSSKDRLSIAAAMGHALAELHRLEWDHPATYAPEEDALVPLHIPYQEWIAARIRQNVDVARRANDRTTSDDLAWVEGIIAATAPAADPLPAPCFVMEDYKEGNVVVQRSGTAWAVSGVFDYMSAHMGDGDADLSRLTAVYLEEDAALADAFLRAYTGWRPPRPGFAHRFRLYMLLDRAIIWEFAQRTGVWWEPTLTLREWAEPYVEARLSALREWV